jgi:hypothetical protein
MIEWAVAAGAVFGLVMLALIDVLPRAFTSDPAVIDRTQEIWPLFALMQPAKRRRLRIGRHPDRRRRHALPHVRDARGGARRVGGPGGPDRGSARDLRVAFL